MPVFRVGKTVVEIHGLRDRSATHQPRANNINRPQDSVSSSVKVVISGGICLSQGLAHSRCLPSTC